LISLRRLRFEAVDGGAIQRPDLISEKMKINIEQKNNGPRVSSIDYHRNGVCGEGFFTGFVYCPEQKRELLFVHFPDPETKNPTTDSTHWEPVRTAILDPDLVAEKNVEFGQNSWRGDYYHEACKEGAEEWERQIDIQFGVKKEVTA
tara:strand:- start:580 stop:1020 length:441 start_codon:yes stop_codon:yes gene_type:complete